MFTRASAKSYICLRCQHKLAFREASKFNRASVQNTVWRRWQSANAVAQHHENDNDGDEPVVHYVTDSPANDGRTTRYRHWQPPPTADLGVSVLGKPAEILVLPQEGRRSRQRKERILAEGDAKDDVASTPELQAKPQLSVSEALAEERRPASQSEITDNIERLRKEFEKPTTEFDPVMRQKCEHALASGFSRAQLEHYISIKGTGLKRKDRLQSSTKKALVAFILDRIWGLEIGTLKTDSMKSTAAYIPVSAEKYELLRMNGTYAACQSTFSNATLSYDPAKARLRVCGNGADIKKIKNIFGPRSTIVTRTMVLTSTLDRLLRMSDTDRSRLQETMRRFTVLAKDVKGSRKLQCWAFSERNLQKFERDLILWQAEKQIRAPELPPLSLVSLEHALTMPAYHGSREYHRYVLPISPSVDHVLSTAEDQNGEKFREVSQNLQEALQAQQSTHSDYDVQSVSSSRSDRFSSEYSVELGQAIFQQHIPEDADADSPKQHSNPASVFVARAPLLPQFLAHQRPLEITTSTASDATSSDFECRHFRIVLQPAKPDIHPSIELHATSDHNSPLSLNIKGVALIFTQLSQMLLLPGTTIDLKVSRRDKYVVLGDELPIQPQFAPVLAQIAEQLVRADVGSDEKRHTLGRTRLDRSINLLFDLDLSCFKSSKTEAEAVAQNQTQGKVRDFEENGGSGANSTSKVKASKSTLFQVRYALKCVETIDTAVYQLPVTATSAMAATATKDQVLRNSLHPGASQPLLEHLILTRMGSNQAQSRTEVVKLVEQPILHSFSRKAESVSEPIVGDNQTTSSEHERFQALIRSAYEIAMELKPFVTERTKMMVPGCKASVSQT